MPNCRDADRRSVIAASACKLVFWNNVPDSQKPSHDPWTVILCTQVAQCLSITTACLLYLKPFLETFESGFIRSDDVRRRGTDDYHSHSTGGSSPIRSAFSVRKPTRSSIQSFGLVTVSNHQHTTTITANDPFDLDAESQHSRSHIIKETRTFTVEDSTS